MDIYRTGRFGPWIIFRAPDLGRSHDPESFLRRFWLLGTSIVRPALQSVTRVIRWPIHIYGHLFVGAAWCHHRVIVATGMVLCVVGYRCPVFAFSRCMFDVLLLAAGNTSPGTQSPDPLIWLVLRLAFILTGPVTANCSIFLLRAITRALPHRSPIFSHARGHSGPRTMGHRLWSSIFFTFVIGASYLNHKAPLFETPWH